MKSNKLLAISEVTGGYFLATTCFKRWEGNNNHRFRPCVVIASNENHHLIIPCSTRTQRPNTYIPIPQGSCEPFAKDCNAVIGEMCWVSKDKVRGIGKCPRWLCDAISCWIQEHTL
jgi:hypothetical protein